MEEVLGDRMTFTVHGLTPSTLYYYKMQARNIKGFGPFSGVGNFTTLPGIIRHVIKNFRGVNQNILLFNLLTTRLCNALNFLIESD